MSRAIAACLALAVFALTADARAQTIAVYESEANFEDYHGVYQQPLRAWLTQRGEDFTVIGDEAAADPDALSAYPVLMTSSCYIVPEAVCEGITEYIAREGRVIWIDSPARSRDAEFRDALGLMPGSTYAPLKECLVEAKQPRHPAAISVEQFEAPSLVGNCAIEAAPAATVLYELSGSTADGAEAIYPAVILNSHGKGKSLCYNWIPWLNTEPEALALLGDGLDYMLADYFLTTRPIAAFCSVAKANVRQPEPVVLTCKAFAPKADGPRPAGCKVEMSSRDRKAASRSVELAWTHADDAVAAATATVEIPTKGLPDKAYTIACAVTVGDAVADAKELTVMLEGQLWAKLQKKERQRRELLEPRLLGTLGDYDAEPRTPDGRVDIPRLMEQIKTAHMNMYDWLIWHAGTDWEDLQSFLPLAQENDIKVWVTLCPPSEQGGNYPWSEPYRLDFIKWAEEIGKLSQQYDNLVALVIDDFWSGGNRTLFTPDYIARMASTLREQNPNVAFLPTIYWRTIGDERWIRDYGPAIDGIVFPYAELETGDALEEQLKACREWIGPDKFLMVNVYASGSSGAGEKGPRTAEYMRRTLTASRELSDGIRIYCLPKAKMLDDYRYAVVAELYGKWRAEDRGRE